MRGLGIALVVLAALAWAVTAAARARRRRYLLAHRTQVIERALARARAKQRDRPPGGGAPPG